MADDRTEAETIWRKYYGDPAGLAEHLTLISTTRPGVVYFVFEFLDSFSDYDVAYRFLNGVKDFRIHTLLQTAEGIVALKNVLFYVKKGPPIFSFTLQQFGVLELNYLSNLINNAKPQTTNDQQPRQLTQAEIDFFTERGTNQTLWKRNGRVVSRKQYDPAICWDLPEKGTGFSTYNVDDLKRGTLGDTKYGYDQIGTKETIDAMVDLAQKWNALHSDRPLQYGDISRPGGINTPDHGTHRTGKAFDMRLLRKDNRTGGFVYTNTAVYDRALTKEFILLAVKNYPGTTVFFNDAELNQKDVQTRDLVDPSDSSHNNHLHVMFPGGRE